MMRRLHRLLHRVDTMLVLLTLLVSWALMQRYSPLEGIGLAEVPYSQSAPVATAMAEEEEEMPAPRQPARNAAPVRFLMYNVQNYFVDADKKRSPHPRRAKPVRERDVVADVIASARPEVIGLIEMSGPAALDDLAERLAARGLKYPHRRVLARWGEDRALALLSMHPIVADRSKADCPLVGQTKRMMLRGLLDITVEAADKRRFRILGVHLKSRVSDNPTAAQALRAREARTLADTIQRILQKNPDAPLLVYGDWNDGPKAPALAVMSQGSTRATTMQRLKPEDANGESWTIYYKDGGEYSTFDQIYVNSALHKRMGSKAKSGIIGETRGKNRSSDHRAVWCDMY